MRTCKVLLFSAAVAVISSAAFAQNYTSPEMPVISSPSLGGGFYMPGSSSNNFYMGPSSFAPTSLNQEMEGIGTELSAQGQELKINSTLNARELKLLDQAGFLNNISSQILKQNSLINMEQQIHGLHASESLSPANLMLKNILFNLEQLKLNQQIASSLEQSQTDSPTRENSIQPKLLNFYINAYNILPSFQDIYISSTQNDGSFLICADRRYLSQDSKYHSETFYMLFKPNDASSGISSYSVAAATSQSTTDPTSLVYLLSQAEKLTAYRTGNLVTIRISESDWQLEFLMDLGY